MAEYGIDEQVIGISFDGVGLGDDGNIWGSEFLLCDLAGYERKTWFGYVPMPGGDMATKEPWRMALSYLLPMYLCLIVCPMHCTGRAIIYRY